VEVEAAYAEAVAALLDATPREATERFDAELAAALTSGRIDTELARSLRWWQRETVRAVRDHAAAVLPPVISGLIASHEAALPASSTAPMEEVPAVTTQPEDVSPEEHRRRTLVASLLDLSDAASA
jgi:hypothetical protein